MATDSVSAHVAAQQKKWEEYLAKHAVEKIYRDMTAEMIAEQPESPAGRAASAFDSSTEGREELSHASKNNRSSSCTRTSRRTTPR